VAHYSTSKEEGLRSPHEVKRSEPRRVRRSNGGENKRATVSKICDPHLKRVKKLKLGRVKEEVAVRTRLAQKLVAIHEPDLASFLLSAASGRGSCRRTDETPIRHSERGDSQDGSDRLTV